MALRVTMNETAAPKGVIELEFIGVDQVQMTEWERRTNGLSLEAVVKKQPDRIIIEGCKSDMSNLFDRISNALKDVFLPFPSSWERTLGRGQYFVVLSPSTQEYTDVQTMFLRTSGPCIVTQIKRVQNLALYRMTEAYKEKIAEETRSTCNNVQRQLWHGTSGSNVQLICANGFSRSYAKPGLAIGQGTYFSTTSQGSMSYAGDSSIILARVTVGRYVQGASGMTQQTLPSGYHSTVNITECPQVFVVYHDAAAYPEYIISFRR